MLKQKILAYNALVPRYTSYPTAPHFKPLAATDYAVWLDSLAPEAGISVYVHIPFCTEMCWYCGCHTTATRKYAPVEDYVTLLLREMRSVAARLPVRTQVRHIHFGGGSPSMLSPQDFARIMETLRELFDVTADAEIAIEADPRGITYDRGEAYAAAGVNRASFGIQDFAPDVQVAINRVQSYDTVARAAERLRGFGITRLNFDLMYGLPRQSLADVQDTAEKSLSLAPDRIALFGYAHVPWMKKHMRLIRDEDLPDAAARLDQFACAESVLLAAGMHPVGLDHFCTAHDDMLGARDGKRLARNFQGYTTDSAPVLIGFGLSSIGRLTQGFVQNHANITEYSAAVLAGALPVVRGCVLSAEDTLRGVVISDLMCYLCADIGAILQRHGQPEDLFDAIIDGLADMEADGLLTRCGRVLHVQGEARQMVRVVAARFDAYFTGQSGRHVQAA
ncbi:MAG: oxygen-independent coproporphyrinogen III oxidase [Alphaproteobacteria bacterium]|nr:oxygen-independent coproporphyrinogen III oxidase [Alphaproteobacteria bacterium]